MSWKMFDGAKVENTKFENAKFDGIIFDLDGTLWNSAKPICRSWNEVIQKKGVKRPPFTEEELMSYMGLPMYDIAAKALPELSKEEQVSLMEEMCLYENEYLAQHGGTLFEGLEQTLETLLRNYRLFIVSNCQDGYIEAFIKAHHMEKYFSDTECWGRTKQPKSESNKILMARNKLTNPVYVGDTQGDADSAKEAGIPFILADYGFGSVEEGDYIAMVEDIRELPEVLAGFAKMD